MDVVTYDGAEFSSSCVGFDSIDDGVVVAPIVSEVGSNGSCSHVCVITDNGVSDVGKVTNVGVAADDGVFDFNGLTDVAVVADGGVATNVAVGPDFTVFSDGHIAFDVDAW